MWVDFLPRRIPIIDLCFEKYSFLKYNNDDSSIEWSMQRLNVPFEYLLYPFMISNRYLVRSRQSEWQQYNNECSRYSNRPLRCPLSFPLEASSWTVVSWSSVKLNGGRWRLAPPLIRGEDQAENACSIAGDDAASSRVVAPFINSGHALSTCRPTSERIVDRFCSVNRGNSPRGISTLDRVESLESWRYIDQSMPAATEGRSIVSKNAANRTRGYDTFTLASIDPSRLERMAVRGMPFWMSFRNESRASPSPSTPPPPPPVGHLGVCGPTEISWSGSPLVVHSPLAFVSKKKIPRSSHRRTWKKR